MPPYFGRYGRVDPNNPEAAGVCDRGGEVVRRSDLRPEMHWAGGRLVPNGLLVCDRHRDVPNPQDGGRRGPYCDPVPVKDPRPEPYLPPGTPGTELRFLMTNHRGERLSAADGTPFVRTAPALYHAERGAITDTGANPLLDADGIALIRTEFPE